MYDALYGRQSIEKKDSISVESQMEYCKYETHGDSYKIYADRGFSGKDLHRPAFEKMMEDIKNGAIKRVIVYKIDRISRSILDFSNLMEVFEKYHVEFISSTEKFDTSTPIGRAMLNICVVFAQLERETIQKRVIDAYYSRSKKGFYMGGRVPYGFQKKKTVIDGIQTSMYEAIPEESEQVRCIYSLYADASNSLGDVVNYLEEHGMKKLRGGMWTTSGISSLLCNPIYVKADAKVYEFFEKQGANQINPVSEYTGRHACYIYKGMASKGRKQSDLTGTEVVLSPHEGIISSEDWLKCRIRCLKNRCSTKTCKAKNSWISGKVKCGNCGYHMIIAKAKTKWSSYFVCGIKLATKGNQCHGAGGTIYADVLEEYIEKKLKEKLSEFQILYHCGEESFSLKHKKRNIRLAEINQEINQILSKVANADILFMQYMNEKIKALDQEKKKLQEEINLFESHIQKKNSSPFILKWEDISFEDKQVLVDIFIQSIHIANGRIEILWNI